MFSLIANISANKIYQMDDHVYNVISTSVEILSGLIGVTALIVGVYGLFTFFNVNKRMKNQDDKLEDNMDEVKKIRKEVYSELIKVQNINLNIIVNNIHSIVVQLIGSFNKDEISLKLTELIEAVKELTSVLPDKNLTVQQIDQVNLSMGFISVVAEGKVEVKESQKYKDLFSALKALADKISWRKINTSDISKEDEDYIKTCLSKIDDTMDKVKKNMK